MEEIRFHGRGGQGVVSGAQAMVKALVSDGVFAHFIPFFGVERKGSPVFGYARINENPIRRKSLIYEPNCVVILDDTLFDEVPVFAGLKPGSFVIINTVKCIDAFKFPENAAVVGIVDANSIASSCTGREIPNTAMLGALAKITGFLNVESMQRKVRENFGDKNVEAFKEAFRTTKTYRISGGSVLEG